MDDPPHQLDLTEALRLLGESCGAPDAGESAELYSTSFTDFERDLRALTAAEDLRAVRRLR